MNILTSIDNVVKLVGEGDVISCISALKKKGLLKREGGRRYGKWIALLEEESYTKEYTKGINL